MSEPKTDQMLEWALRYIRMGWPVFPLRGKVPLVGNGSKEATLNESTVRGWWKKFPNANIGLATGHRFFAFDVDIKSGGEESFEYLFHHYGPFPETVQQITGTGGKHLLFLWPDFPVRNSTNFVAQGIDIRGVGGYIVAAPSIHPETKRPYFWDGMAEIEAQPIAPAPAWLLQKLKTPTATTAPAKTVDARISEGSRNTELFRLACSLRRKGLSEEEILATLKVSNQLRCSPPLPDPELQTIAKSCARYAPDARASLFRGGRGRGGDRARAPRDGADAPDEAPITGADVESAVDEVISRNAVGDAMRLAPAVAPLPKVQRSIILLKLREQFGRDFLRFFEAAMKDAAARAADSAGSSGAPPPPEDQAPPPDGPDLTKQPYTDSGNAERIVALYGLEIRYCVEMKKWLVWDGRRWAVDEMGTIRQKAKQMARILYAQAIGNPVLEKHARHSESSAGITAALMCAATEKGIAISILELDQHPFLLNCANGVIDLRTEKLLPHDRDLLMTKLCPVPFQPAAECPRFLQFIEWAMGGNTDNDLLPRTAHLVGFLQRAFGYALTGDVTEKALFVFYGKDGNNGKTTLLTLFRDLLGKDYSNQLSIDTVMAAKQLDTNARADLADLRGARFVVTSEVEKGSALNERVMKYLTSGADAPIKSCRKYENPVEFNPSHKIFVDGNHRPRVMATDQATWARLKLVPFEVQISKEEMDRSLKDKLRAELPGVLAWAVRGCASWFRDGLGVPAEIDLAIEEWKQHDDPLKVFLEDFCEVGEGLFVTVRDISAAYDLWVKQNREKFPLGGQAFKERMLAKDFEENRSRRINEKQTRTWEGLELKNDVIQQIRKTAVTTGSIFSE